MKRKIVIFLLILLALLFAWIWYSFCGGVTHRELKVAVEREGAETRAHVDQRCDALEKKLDRIESKLDRLIEMATPKLPDGMQPAR